MLLNQPLDSQESIIIGRKCLSVRKDQIYSRANCIMIIAKSKGVGLLRLWGIEIVKRETQDDPPLSVMSKPAANKMNKAWSTIYYALLIWIEFQDSQVMMCCYKEQQYRSAIGKVCYY